MRLALDDSQAWSELKLPLRLKIELKLLLLAEQTVSTVDDTSQLWYKCFSTEEQCPYYYNSLTKETVWELPPGAQCVENDDVTMTNSDIATDTNESALLKEKEKRASETSKVVEELINSLSPQKPVQMASTLPVVKEPNCGSRQSAMSKEASKLVDLAFLTATREIESKKRHVERQSASDNNFQRLLEMGFPKESALIALHLTDNDLDKATSFLVAPPLASIR